VSRVPRRTVLALTAVVGLLAAGGALVLRDEHPTRQAAPTPSRPAPTSSRTPAARPSLPDVTWTTYTGVRVPVSRSAGPRDLREGLARGFARTDLGAALAAVHIDVRASYLTTPAVYRATVRGQVVGPDAPLLLSNLEEGYTSSVRAAGVAPGQPTGVVANATIRGWRVTAGTGDSRTVSLLLSGPDERAMTVWVA
jgi:hypothetical protein